MRNVVFVLGLAIVAIGLGGAAQGFIAANSTDSVYSDACTGDPIPSPDVCAANLFAAAVWRTVAVVMTGLFVVGSNWPLPARRWTTHRDRLLRG